MKVVTTKDRNGNILYWKVSVDGKKKRISKDKALGPQKSSPKKSPRSPPWYHEEDLEDKMRREADSEIDFCRRYY